MSGAKSGAREYSWAPFGVGNDVGMRAGAWSERRLAPLVEAHLAWLSEHAPWASMEHQGPAAVAWAHAEARVTLMRRWFDEHDQLNAEGVPAPGLVALDRAESRAATLRDQLGIGPMALARLLGALGSIDAPRAQEGLEALRRTGAELMAKAHERTLAAVPELAPPASDGRA